MMNFVNGLMILWYETGRDFLVYISIEIDGL